MSKNRCAKNSLLKNIVKNKIQKNNNNYFFSVCEVFLIYKALLMAFT